MNARLIPSHTGCANCPHVADEHSATGCTALAGNSAHMCACTGYAATGTEVPTLAIATDEDMIATIPADVLTSALTIARVQMDDCDDDEWEAYGEPIDREAAVIDIDRTLATLRTALAGMARSL